jgi:hypothetical protein
MKFEYKFEVDIAEQTHDEIGELNKLGAEGWELVAVSPYGLNHLCLGYWFKRPLK